MQYFTCCGPGFRGAICPNAMARTRVRTIGSTAGLGEGRGSVFSMLWPQNRHSLYLIDSTIVKSHRAASGAKGGRKIKRLASAVVGGPRKSMRSSMARVDH